jgi:hypothetical protein
MIRLKSFPIALLVLTTAIADLGPCLALAEQGPDSLDTAAIEKLTGASGKLDQKQGVFKVSVPRKDLSVVIAGVRMTPPMGLTSWAAFQRSGKDDMVMGDLVLTQEQISPVMDAALDNGLQVTALHNHFVSESRRIMFMHIGGMGPEQDVATAVGRVFSTIGATSNRKEETARIVPEKSSLDTANLDAALGLKGEYKDGVYKVVVGRVTMMHDVTVGSQMGVNTWGTFAGSDKEAVVDGDVAMRESEVQNVLKALRKAGINVVAIHQHMIGEEPRIIFLHYWGVGPAGELAKGLRAALDATRD